MLDFTVHTNTILTCSPGGKGGKGLGKGGAKRHRKILRDNIQGEFCLRIWLVGEAPRVGDWVASVVGIRPLSPSEGGSVVSRLEAPRE